MDKRPIGIFDSGVGGLSILREVKKLLPEESIVYLGDQKFVPYGSKSPDDVRDICKKNVQFLVDQNVKTIIIACNTATMHALDYLRTQFDIPIIGTVPVVKVLAENTKTGRVAIFSTPSTGQSQYLKELVKKFANGLKVYVIDETGLELLVERGEIESPELGRIYEDHLLPLIDHGVDCIALACTHYPFLRDQIQKVLGSEIKIYDSGAAIARQTKRVLKNNNTLNTQNQPTYSYFTTGDPAKFKRVGEMLLGEKLEEVKRAGI